MAVTKTAGGDFAPCKFFFGKEPNRRTRGKANFGYRQQGNEIGWGQKTVLRSRWWWQGGRDRKTKRNGPNLFFSLALPAATIASTAIPIVGWADFIALLPIAAEKNPTDGQGAKLTSAIGNRQ
jgi:hypothetical protein